MRISERERAYVAEVLDTQFRSSAGSRMTARLERKFAEMFNVRFAIAHINGTATLHSALAAVGVGPGDEVIVPPLTMASTSFAVMHCGAVPVFADVDARTFNLDPAKAEACITPRTKAIMPVALFGLSPDLDPILAIAARRKLAVIEDDAQCLLGYYKGRIVGSIGTLSSFSFQSSKQLTSGEGGMVLTDDEEAAEAVRRFNSLGYAAVGAGAGKGKITRETIQDPVYERHASVGFNYRMPELCAAVALGQLERLRELVDWRIACAGEYSRALAGCDWLTPQYAPADYVHSYWAFTVKLEPMVDFTWYDFRAKFREFGGDGIYAAWQLTYLEPAFREKELWRLSPLQVRPCNPGPQVCARGLCPVAESLQPRLLQFKTNYTEISKARQQAEALARTIDFFNRAGVGGSVSTGP
jgi:perosamine synthetase